MIVRWGTVAIESLGDDPDKFRCAIRLAKGPARSESFRPFQLLRANTRYRNDQCAVVFRKNLFNEENAVGVRHHEISDDQVDVIALKGTKCNVTARREEKLVPRTLEGGATEKSVPFLVVDNEYVSHLLPLRGRLR